MAELTRFPAEILDDYLEHGELPSGPEIEALCRIAEGSDLLCERLEAIDHLLARHGFSIIDVTTDDDGDGLRLGLVDLGKEEKEDNQAH